MPYRKPVAEDIETVGALVQMRTGIEMAAKQQYGLSSSLQKRMSALDLTFDEYYQLLAADQRLEGEFQYFLELLIVNETFFFRDQRQLEVFVEECLPEVKQTKRVRGSQLLKAWSAGCSTGEEPYSLAMLMLDAGRNETWRYMIAATDISRHYLEIARQGVYSRELERTLPESFSYRYCDYGVKGYAVKPIVKQMVQFSCLNLTDFASLRAMRNFDFVFCKNVLFYFSMDAQQRVIRALYESLAPGGYLFLSLAYPITNYVPDLDFRVKHKYYYRKA